MIKSIDDLTLIKNNETMALLCLDSANKNKEKAIKNAACQCFKLLKFNFCSKGFTFLKATLPF